MYGIFTYMYHKSQRNVGKYTIHGWYGLYLGMDGVVFVDSSLFDILNMYNYNTRYGNHAPRAFKYGQVCLRVSEDQVPVFVVVRPRHLLTHN